MKMYWILGLEKGQACFTKIQKLKFYLSYSNNL